MIGGLMVLSAVAAILLLSVWSARFDDWPDDAALPGPFGLRVAAASKSAAKNEAAPPVARKPRRAVRMEAEEIAFIEEETARRPLASRGRKTVSQPDEQDILARIREELALADLSRKSTPQQAPKPRRRRR